MADTEIELKPCPFCGKPALLWRTNYATYIQCGDYNPRRHQVCIIGSSDKAAAKKWNERKEGTANAAMVAAIELLKEQDEDDLK